VPQTSIGSNFLFLVDLKYKQQIVLAQVITTKHHSPSDLNNRRLFLQCWRLGRSWCQQVQALFLTCRWLPSCYVLIQWREEVLVSLPFFFFFFPVKYNYPIMGAAPSWSYLNLTISKGPCLLIQRVRASRYRVWWNPVHSTDHWCFDLMDSY